MPTMASLVEEFQRQAWLVHGRVPYAQAQPRTRTEQHRMLEKAAEAILMTQGIKVQVGIGGQLMLRLPGTADVAGMVQTAAEAEAVQEDRVQGADGFFLGQAVGTENQRNTGGRLVVFVVSWSKVVHVLRKERIPRQTKTETRMATPDNVSGMLFFFGR